MPTTLKRLHVCTIHYKCRPIDPRDKPESGILDGFWNGEVDAWGKHTINTIDGSNPLYLFADEIVSVEEWVD